METTSNLIRFRDLRTITGWEAHTLTRRVQRAGISHFIDGLDRRQRAIAANDLPKLIATETAPKRREANLT